jgi:hypothetical protein
VSADFSLKKTPSSSVLPQHISRTHVANADFADSLSKAPTTTPLTDTPGTAERRETSPEQKQLENTQRAAILGITPNTSSPKERLQHAMTHYEKNKTTAPSPQSQSLLEKIASRLLPQPDPNIQKFNELHTLYATALPICGESLRQLISEDDMQHTVETVWKTGKVDINTLELFETAIVSIVNEILK